MFCKEMRGDCLERRWRKKLSMVLKVDSGGRKEQALMLGLLWDQVPSDATKNFSRRLCRSGFYALFQIYGWVSPRPTYY